MAIQHRWGRRVAGAFCALGLAGGVHADVLLNTGAPDGGFLGYYGFDVFVGQSVAIAFTPTQNYFFDTVGLWMMSNDFEAAGRMLTVSLQTDAGGGATPVAPSGTSLESWAHATTAIGWSPVLETISSVLHPVLTAGHTYWIVAESNEPAFVDPVWVAASSSSSFTMGNIDFQSSPNWQVGMTNGPPGTMVTATAVPEPAIFALALLGVPLVFGAAKRRSTAG